MLFFADGVEIGNVITTVTDPDAPVSVEITNVNIENNDKHTPFPKAKPDDGKITAEISNINVTDNGSFKVQSLGLGLLAANGEASADKLVTITFDLKNSSARAVEFDVYSGVYDENNTLCSVVKKPEKFEAGEKRQVLLNVKVPNNGKTMQGKIFIWDSVAGQTAISKGIRL